MHIQIILCKRLAAAGGLLVCAVAMAQDSTPLDAPAERLRINAERSQHEAAFEQAERDCYRRFAVSDCLNDARHARRAALDELRRQEIVLNDLDRRTRAAQALQRIQNNVSESVPAAAGPR